MTPAELDKFLELARETKAGKSPKWSRPLPLADVIEKLVEEVRKFQTALIAIGVSGGASHWTHRIIADVGLAHELRETLRKEYNNPEYEL